VSIFIAFGGLLALFSLTIAVREWKKRQLRKWTKQLNDINEEIIREAEENFKIDFRNGRRNSDTKSE
jgi:hypothetical protein